MSDFISAVTRFYVRLWREIESTPAIGVIGLIIILGLVVFVARSERQS